MNTEDVDIKSNGLELVLEYNNTDFYRNPTRGSTQRLSLTHDFSWGNSTDTWTVVKAEASKYISLGAKKFRQRVLALNVWTADTPSWEERLTAGGVEIRHRSPPYIGATLGGVRRMRGYTINRYHERAAIYY